MFYKKKAPLFRKDLKNNLTYVIKMIENYLELIHSGIIVLSCLFIILRTKKIYNLTSHKGIKAFRNAFGYWALAYTARIVAILSIESELKYYIGTISALVFMYALSMAGFSLVYSLVWKNLGKNRNYFLHMISITIALLNVFIINKMAGDVKISDTFKGVLPFLMSDLLRVILLYAFPGITLVLIRLFP